MNVREVHEFVRAGRAVKAPHYHAGKRGISFLQILVALERCHAVEPDRRLDHRERLLHPDGWYALANLPGRRRLRVDFDLVVDEGGKLLLVVTAYEV